MLDVYELCTPELQEKLLPVRSKFKEVEDKKLEKQQQKAGPFSPSCTLTGLKMADSSPLGTFQLPADEPEVLVKFLGIIDIQSCPP